MDSSRIFLDRPKWYSLWSVVLLLFGCNAMYTWRLYQLTKLCRNSQCTENSPRHKESVFPRREEPRKDTGEVLPADLQMYDSNGPSETGILNSSLEGPLPAAFQRALDTYPVVQAAGLNIVLVVAYYRSGSTFTGELISSADRSFFHFEPLHPFTVSGRIRPGRERDAFDLLDELIRCRMVNVPLYSVWCENHPQFVHLNRFLAEVCDGGESCFSPGHVGALCSRAKTQVFKFTRLHMSQVGAWIGRNHEFAKSIRVVHLVRDPRAIIASRKRIRWCKVDEECGKAEALCAQIRSDIDSFESGIGPIKQIRLHRLYYEHLAADPVNETRRLFSTLGLEYTPSVSQYLKIHTTATLQDLKNKFSTKRKPELVIHSWKQQLSKNEIADIEEKCTDVLLRLGYEFLVRNASKTSAA
ncbi:carbohydrate sulfotransferase 5-like isoform X2 [Haemaphysalis longicornis]